MPLPLSAISIISLSCRATIAKRTSLQTKLVELQAQVDRQERIATQKAKYLSEVAALNEAFQMALTKLPDKREIQPLFQSVATSGKSAGLDFLLFEPKPPPKPPEAKPSVKDNLKPSDQQAAQKPAAGAPAAPGKRRPRQGNRRQNRRNKRNSMRKFP